MQIVTLINFFIVVVPPYSQIVILRPAGAAAHSPGQRPEDNEAMSHAQQGQQHIAQGNALGINVKAIYALKGQKRHSICQMNQKKEKKLLYKTILLLVREVLNRLQRYGKVFKLPKNYVIIFENQAKLMLESVEQFLKM